MTPTLRPGAEGRSPARRWASSTFGIGVLALVLTLGVGYVMFQKDMLTVELTPGDTMTIHFAQDYRLRTYVTPVKVGGVKVGRVSDIERLPDGSALVEVKLEPGMADKVGSAPSAAIRPTIILGGNYYLEVVPGGLHGDPFTGEIPVERTSVPVELDRISATLQPDARAGVRSSTDRLDQALRDGGREALEGLVQNAPGALGPGADVLRAAQGSNTGDLTRVVSGIESAAVTLSRNEGQLDAIVGDLATTSRVLGTLQTTDAGLRRLDTTLAKLRETADPARGVVGELGTLIEHADPVLVAALPVVRDLREVLADTRPLVEDLVPASERGTDVLDDVRGPVLERVNGPIVDTVLSPYEGTGPYEGSGGDGKPLYEELGFMVSSIDRASKATDANGATVGFQPGFGAATVSGTPVSLEQLFANLAGFQNPDAEGAGR
jgi:phospholipid/cholesterol/gamma-HCH transport system substrate-binding protein